ncbi:hypothetical protein SCHPADRAFT_944262 [Schizopora paradoxa]|uniref:Uncharacterized protein n=1 Tax=Schizopora paradoxa TaxID=27342 RepID=A0A0H2R9X1_9AGAM|nr:hypothetical protein SCHPADRAFT_944262 [Schizopora paradoxa]
MLSVSLQPPQAFNSQGTLVAFVNFMEDVETPSFVRRTKSKSARGRESPSTKATDDDDDVTTAATLRNKQKARAKPKARLSFGGDDEDGADDFKVKKSNLSRKLKLGSSTPLRSDIDGPEDLGASVSSPKYSKEYLSELKAGTPSTPSNQKTASSNDSDLSFDIEELSGAVIVDESMELDVTPEIPSESSILAAKQKRERMRETKPSDDDGFISLTVTRRDTEYQGPHPESRLVREEDELGEGDDEFAEYTSAQERIALGKKAKKKESEKKKMSMAEMIEDAEEEDEETLEWEREQLRRGGKGNDYEKSTSVKQEYRPAPIPPPSSLPTLEAATSRLSLSLTQLTESHAKSTALMTSLADERQTLEVKEKEMRSMVENAEEKRSWFNVFSEWVETVVDEKCRSRPLFDDAIAATGADACECVPGIEQHRALPCAPFNACRLRREGMVVKVHGDERERGQRALEHDNEVRNVLA